MITETNLTTKERRLVEMVQRAMREEENVDYTMGRHDDPNQLPNPPAELTIPEGEDMVNEKPLPKYNSIEELMKEIENGTNEAAHKYKMDEMKRVYEALEAKVGSLEEGEGADFVDARKVKQMKKDIMTLRKQAEKLEKEYDKKFAKKEGKKETVKESKMENFDLKKFLVENKLTTNSKMLKENINISAETRQEIANGIQVWVPKDVKATSDHLGETITQALEEEGIELPEGMFNNNMHNALLALSIEFHSGQLPIEAAVQKAISIAMNPANYR